METEKHKIMKRTLVLAVTLLSIGIAQAQYFDGTHPGLPLLGRNSSLDGGSLTNLNATNLVGTIPATNVSGSINASNLVGSISANLTGDGSGLTNLAAGPVVVAGSGCTVTPSTNASTGIKTYTVTVP